MKSQGTQLTYIGLCNRPRGVLRPKGILFFSVPLLFRLLKLTEWLAFRGFSLLGYYPKCSLPKSDDVAFHGILVECGGLGYGNLNISLLLLIVANCRKSLLYFFLVLFNCVNMKEVCSSKFTSGNFFCWNPHFYIEKTKNCKSFSKSIQQNSTNIHHLVSLFSCSGLLCGALLIGHSITLFHTMQQCHAKLGRGIIVKQIQNSCRGMWSLIRGFRSLKYSCRGFWERDS